MRSSRKLTAFVLLTAVATTSLAPIPASAAVFSDVSESHWAYEQICEISDQKIMVGREEGIFAPESTLSRAEYATILYHLAPESSASSGEHTAGVDNGLTDVDAADWFAETVDWAVSRGILRAENGKVHPNDPITREDMGVATYEFLSLYCSGKFSLDDSECQFKDNNEFHSQAAQDKIFILANNGLLAGRENGYFEPQGTLTRAEAAVMASRIQSVQAIELHPNSFKDDARAALTAGTAEVSKTEQQFIDLLNDDRVAAGTNALEVSPLLMAAAEQRAKEICQKCEDLTRDEFYDYESEFFHARPDGRPSKTVLEKFLGQPSVVLSSNIYFGENLVRRWGDSTMTPTRAYNSLLTSPGHVSNMMGKNYDYIGVAYHNDGHMSVWVQLFGAAR